MNTVDEHNDKARHNLAFLDSIDLTEDRFADWAIVVLFYAALHYVRAAIHSQGRDHGTTHPKTQAAVQAGFSPARALSYERLYSRSRLVRYEVLGASLNDYMRLRERDFDPLVVEAESYLQQT